MIGMINSNLFDMMQIIKEKKLRSKRLLSTGCYRGPNQISKNPKDMVTLKHRIRESPMVESYLILKKYS